MGRDDFLADTIRKLGERVGLHCSNPECNAATKGPHTEGQKATNLGKACHIRAAAPGGPRFDSTQTSEERRSIDNGIWLCSNCSTLIDADEASYPEATLRLWKANAELSALESLGRPTRASSAPLGLIGRLAAIPKGTIARIVYRPLNNEDYVHDKFQIEILDVDLEGNVLRIQARSGQPGPPDAIPLEDVEATWCPDGVHRVRVGGYMNFNPSAPYRYISRRSPRSL